MIHDLITRMISSIIGIASPAQALRYQHGRELLKRGYKAAQQGGPNQQWITSNTTADKELATLDKIRSRCRDLGRNNPWVAGAMNTMVHNVIGISRDPQPGVTDSQGELWAEVNDALLELYWQWECQASTDGASIQALQELSIKHQMTDGEILFRKVIDKKAEFIPLRYQAIEADQIDSTHDTGDWYMGVKIANLGQPQAYAIYDGHPGDMRKGYNVLEIPSNQILHVFRKDRVSQHRGVPWLASIVWKLFELDEYMEYEQIGAKLASAFGVFIESDYQSADLGTQASLNTGTEKYNYIKPGLITKLSPGEKVNVAEHSRPNGAFPHFISSVLRACATGLNMGYETIANDYSTANYSSMRSSKIEERNNYKAIHARQARLMYVPMWQEFVKWCVMTEKLKITSPAGRKRSITMEEYSRNKFNFNAVTFPAPVFPWVDPLKDIKSEIEAINANLKSRSEYLIGQGKAPMDVFQTIAAEKQLMEDLGITPEEVQEVEPGATENNTAPESDDEDEVGAEQPANIKPRE